MSSMIGVKLLTIEDLGLTALGEPRRAAVGREDGAAGVDAVVAGK